MKKETVQVAIYQASTKTLIDSGVWGTIQDLNAGKITLPAVFYRQVFNGEVNVYPQSDVSVLDQIFQIFYRQHSASYLGRSIWVGDVIRKDGKFYLCKPVGFQECEFNEKRAIHLRPELDQKTIQKAEQVLIDNGIDPDEAQTVLQALGYVLLNEELYPEN